MWDRNLLNASAEGRECRLTNQEEDMADNGSSTASTGIVAILVIFVILVIAALFVFGGRWFGGNKRIDVNIGTPAK